jgi:NADPH2:quinone reductase
MRSGNRKMKAAAIDHFGPPSALKLHQLPIPKPGPHEVLIAVDTAGVGSWDASIRDGSWRAPGRARFPLIPGTDGAGTVVAKGRQVQRFRLGDRVYGYEFGNRNGGFYAEYATVNANHLGHVPKPLNLREAGAVAATGLTAMQGIQKLGLRRNQTILIFGASGAVGTIAVQFAKQRGARVLATASKPAAKRMLRQLGVEAVIDARTKSGIEQLKSPGTDGIAAVFALAGGRELERCLQFLRPGGRVVHPNGIEPVPRHRRRVQVRAFDAEASPREFSELGHWIGKARLRVPIAATYSLAQAGEAHRRLEKNGIIGRMSLRVGRANQLRQ